MGDEEFWDELDPEDLVVDRRKNSIAIYWNPDGKVTIRQHESSSAWVSEDAWVIFESVNDLDKAIARLTALRNIWKQTTDAKTPTPPANDT